MGLLDGILGSVLGGAQNQGQQTPGAGADPMSALLGQLLGGANGQQSPLLQIGLSLIQQQGGLTGLIEKLKASGLDEQVASWVGTGPNMPVSGDQLTQALGSQAVGQIASQLGMQPSAASGALAALLPQIVNQMTPQGNVPSNHNDLLSMALSALTK